MEGMLGVISSVLTSRVVVAALFLPLLCMHGDCMPTLQPTQDASRASSLSAKQAVNAKQAVPKLENGWNNVVALYLKSTDTVALPIYQKPA